MCVCVSQQVHLDFNGFDTEQCCDYVYMYDGPTVKSPLIDSLSGSYASPPVGFISSQRYMFVRFVTDKTNTLTGFIATYTSLSTGRSGYVYCGYVIKLANGTSFTFNSIYLFTKSRGK